MPAAANAADTQTRLPLGPMRVDVRSASQLVLALLASLFAMRSAREVLVPICLGVMMSHALMPLVDRLQRLRIPRPASSALLLVGIATAIGWGTWSLRDEADALLDTIPRVVHRLRELTEEGGGSLATFSKVERAASEIAAAAMGAASAASVPPASGAASAPVRAAARRAAPVQAAPPSAPASKSPAVDVRGYLLSGTLSVLVALGQTAVVFLIALFLLATGNTFRRKMVKLAGPRLSRKKVTVETLDEIADQIQRYLLVQLGASVIVGIVTWLAFEVIGMQQAAMWGVLAGITNLIPYLGALLVGAGAAIVAFVQFGTVEMAAIVSAASFGTHFVVGNVLTPWWTGRASRMSPFAVFVVVLVFGWLWGVWGLLLGVPILLIVKAVCDRVDELKPVGELLGD